MIEIYLSRDNLKKFIAVKYSLDISLDWLKKYISNETDFDGLDDFLDSYSSDDVEEIINSLDDDDEPYTLQEEDRFSYYD